MEEKFKILDFKVDEDGNPVFTIDEASKKILEKMFPDVSLEEALQHYVNLATTSVAAVEEASKELSED
jgi:division protein CdvB (Snf7/Vps24/ESCRT-III family)